MDGFLLALLLVFALSLGGRDQWLIAQLAETLGRSTPLMAIGATTAALSAMLMAWAGAEIAAVLPARAGQMLVALALALAAFELAWPVKGEAPREPTRSLGAIAIVLFARQVTDGARFVIFALAAWAHLPAATALGGALAGAGAILFGCSLGRPMPFGWPLRSLRLTMAGVLLVAALFIGLDARFGSL